MRKAVDLNPELLEQLKFSKNYGNAAEFCIIAPQHIIHLVNSMTEQKQPPLHLVKTWIWMMTSSDDAELQASGQQKLIAAFGSMLEVQKYLQQHQA